MTRSTRRILLSAAVLLSALTPSTVLAEPCMDDDGRDICRGREIYFMPGAQAVLFVPNAPGAEPFVGAGVQIAPLLWTHNSESFGPGQGALFAQVSLLSSAGSNATMGLFEVGTTLTFEKNASRRWMIPYFGLSIGGLVHDGLPNAAFTHALAGMHVFWHHNLIVDLQGGYHFPFGHLDMVSGPRAQATVRFSMW